MGSVEEIATTACLGPRGRPLRFASASILIVQVLLGLGWKDGDGPERFGRSTKRSQPTLDFEIGFRFVHNDAEWETRQIRAGAEVLPIRYAVEGQRARTITRRDNLDPSACAAQCR